LSLERGKNADAKAERKAMLKERLFALIGKRVSLQIAGDKTIYRGTLGRIFHRGREIWTVQSAEGKEQCRAEASSINFVEGEDLTIR
jgi:hypothetical protein